MLCYIMSLTDHTLNFSFSAKFKHLYNGKLWEIESINYQLDNIYFRMNQWGGIWEADNGYIDLVSSL